MIMLSSGTWRAAALLVAEDASVVLRRASGLNVAGGCTASASTSGRTRATGDRCINAAPGSAEAAAPYHRIAWAAQSRRGVSNGYALGAAAETSPASQASSGASGSISSTPDTATSALPMWLRTLLPGGRHLDVKPPVAPKQLQQEVVGSDAGSVPQAGADSTASQAVRPANSAEADRRKEYIEYLEQHKDLTVDGFVDLNKQLWMGSQPPRPRVLQLPRSHPDAKRYIDWKRVSYLRTMQHERIASMMSDAEKAAVRERGRDVLTDRPLLSAIAQRTGVYMDDEVKDCLHNFFETRDHMRRLYRWVVVLGEPEPMSSEAQAAALKEMEALEADEARMEKLERQDRTRCPILPVLDFVGHDAVCSRTGLKYHECCGGVQGRPAGLVARDLAKDLRGLRGRKAPRSERELRKYMRDRNEAHKWRKP